MTAFCCVAAGAPPSAIAATATCDQYTTQAAAQAAGDTLDADGDGIYCETLPCPCSTVAPLRLAPLTAAAANTMSRSAIRREFKATSPTLTCKASSNKIVAVCRGKTRTVAYTSTVTRRGPPASPVDHYKIVRRARGRATVTRSNRVIIAVRSARLSQALGLTGITTGTEIEATPSPLADPFMPTNPFEAAPAGMRWVATSVTVKNVGRAAFDDNASHSSHLDLSDGTSIRGGMTSDCLGRATVAPGASAVACIAFLIPATATVVDFKMQPYTVGLETGVWRP